jgi:DNA recombination protein RmuC
VTILALTCLAGLAIALAVAFWQAQKAEHWRRIAEDHAVRAAQAQASAEASERSAAEQIRLLEAAQGRLEHSFRALAADALQANSQQFLDRSREQMLGLVSPVQDTLKRFESNVQQLEKARAEAYGNLSAQIRGLLESEAELRRSAETLRNALRSPQHHGRWGELQLRRVVELAGMVARCDFSEQVSLDAGRLRPDLVVHLPNGRNVAVDSKVSLDAYLRALEASSDVDRERCLLDHARRVRAHVKALGEKAYWERLEGSPEFVIAFLPLESLYSAALQHDSELLSFGVEKRVLLATPTTLIAVLFSIAQGWRDREFSENATQIRDLGKDLYGRIVGVHGKFGELGRELQSAVEAYNSAIWGLESRVLVSARRFGELQGSEVQSLDELQPLHLTARQPAVVGRVEPIERVSR